MTADHLRLTSIDGRRLAAVALVQPHPAVLRVARRRVLPILLPQLRQLVRLDRLPLRLRIDERPGTHGHRAPCRRERTAWRRGQALHDPGRRAGRGNEPCRCRGRLVPRGAALGVAPGAVGISPASTFGIWGTNAVTRFLKTGPIPKRNESTSVP